MREKLKLSIFLVIVMLLSGCMEENHSDKFHKFLEGGIITVEREIETIRLPSKFKIKHPMFFLEKEKKDYRPKVVLNVVLIPDDAWLLDIDRIKKDMRYLGELVIEYAEKEEWKNDYYLYITTNLRHTLGSLVYDYETDILHVPKRYDDYLSLYRKFGTLDIRNIEEKDGGIDYLVSKRIGRIVHNKYEYDIGWLESYNVYILKGEFNSYGSSNSDRH